MLTPPQPAEPEETFGERLRRLRIERGLSQRRLSRCGISYAYISRLEAGERTPSVEAIRALARALGVTPNYLETGAELTTAEALELRLADAELRLRLGDHSPEATSVLQAVIKEARDAGEMDLVVRAQVALGLASLAAGNFRGAIRHLGEATDSPFTSPATHASAYISLSKAYRFAGQAGKAVEVLERALTDLGDRAPVDRATRLRLATYLTYALTDAGDLDRAHEVIRESASEAETADPRSHVRLIWSLARLTYMEGRPRTAVREMRRAIAVLDHTEDTLELCRAHLFCVEVSLWGHDLDTAEAHLQSASRLRKLPADEGDLAALTACEALIHARRGRFAQARACAQEALQELADAPAEQGMAQTALALALAGQGEVDAANDAYADAVDALELSREYHEAIGVCREWANLLKRSHRPTEAADVTRRAHELTARAQREALHAKR